MKRNTSSLSIRTSQISFYKNATGGTYFRYCDTSMHRHKNKQKCVQNHSNSRIKSSNTKNVSISFHKVTSLKRVRIMNIHLDIPVGKYRELRPAELKNSKNFSLILKKRTIDLRPRVSISIRVVRKRPVAPCLASFCL